MKIILSRKGFDSANGGIVSPIFDDGTMVSLPIPSCDTDTYGDLLFKDIEYADILQDLKYKGSINCHLDPDLEQDRRKNKIPGWFPSFGQIDAASYLRNINIEVGDIFLFFGNFHFVEEKNGKYKYMRKTGDFYKDNDLQVIWGYLQVGEIITDPMKQKEIWWHPHANEYRINNNTNIIFKAAEKLSIDKTKPGAGLLSFDKKRVLTLEGCTKATWKMNKIYDVEHVYSNRKNSSKNPKESIYYAGIWQELGLKESDECLQWAKNILM